MKPVLRGPRPPIESPLLPAPAESRRQSGLALRRPWAAGLILASGAWLVMVLLVRPAGEFPLNDDWSYARAVYSLVESGRLRLTGFTSMPLIAQAVWGALFCLPFGFSFTALRISTLALGWIGIVAVHGILAEIQDNATLPVLAAMTVAVNPLYFQLSLTFMTDVPFFAATMLAILFFLRSLRTGRMAPMLAGYVASLAAILIRQPAVVVPFSFLVAYLIQNRFSLRALLLTLPPNLALAGLLLKYPSVLRRTVGLPALFNRSYEPIAESATQGAYQIPFILADRLLVALIYCGLFILPFAVIVAYAYYTSAPSGQKRVRFVLGGILAAGLAALTVAHNRLLPLTGNVLFNLGLGPTLLRDTYLLNLPHWPTAPRPFWILLTSLALLGSVVLLLGLGAAAAQAIRHARAKQDWPRSARVFLLSLVISYALLIGLTGFLDRYLLWLLPLLMGILLLEVDPAGLRLPPGWGAGAVLLLGLFAGFAVAGTHDYLAWNRARWQSLATLMQADGISPNRIDGGFEFNGWYAYDPGYRIKADKSWWWVQDDEYLLAFGAVDGYAVMRRYPFERWLPPGQGEILVLQRIEIANPSLGEAR